MEKFGYIHMYISARNLFSSCPVFKNMLGVFCVPVFQMKPVQILLRAEE
jgi:hypothetical protein